MAVSRCHGLLSPSGWRRLLVLLSLSIASGVHAQEQAAADPSTPRFDVLEYRVEGNSVLPVESIERAVYPFMGERRTVDDVESARLALEAAYRNAGYGTVVVDTPEQRITDGVVTLQVLQAPVSRLRVVGAQYYSQGRILDKVPALVEGGVPNFKEVTAQLATVNRSADRRVTPLLRPGKAPGTTEVDLTVEDKFPLHGSLELNNKSSPNTTETRLQASLRYDNLWQREHSISGQVQVSPEDTSEVKVFSGSYTVPTGSGLLVFSYTRSNSSTVAGVGSTTIFGRGSIYGLRSIWLLDGTETLNHSITLSADYKDFMESISVGSNAGFSTPIHYLPLGASYAATMVDKDGYWQTGGGLTFALRGMASSQSQFDDKRFKAQNNFAILKLNVARTQNLPRGFTLYGSLEGQLSDQPLISNEQFVAGGVDSVRGYLEAQAVGDKALRGSIELRTDNLAREAWRGWLGDLRAHAFVDGAELWLNKPLPGQASSSRLISVGLGLRVRALDHASLSFNLAWPLHDAGSTRKGDPRLQASGVLEF